MDNWEPVFSESRFENKFKTVSRKGSSIVLRFDYPDRTAFYYVEIDGEQALRDSDDNLRTFSRSSPLIGLYDKLYRYHNVERRNKKHQKDYYERIRQEEERAKLRKLRDKF